MNEIWHLEVANTEEATTLIKRSDQLEDSASYFFSTRNHKGQIAGGEFERNVLEHLYHRIGQELGIPSTAELTVEKMEPTFTVVLQITDRHGIVKTEESLYINSCGGRVVPSSGSTIIHQGQSYLIRGVVWDYDKSVIYVLCHTKIIATVRTAETRGGISS